MPLTAHGGDCLRALSVALPYLNAVRLLLEVHVGEPEKLIKHTRRQVYITGRPSPSSEGVAIRAVSQSGNAGVPVRQSLRPETEGCLRQAHMGEARSNFPLPRMQYLGRHGSAPSCRCP